MLDLKIIETTSGTLAAAGAKSFLKFMDQLTKILPNDKKSITSNYIKAKEKQHGESK